MKLVSEELLQAVAKNDAAAIATLSGIAQEVRPKLDELRTRDPKDPLIVALDQTLLVGAAKGGTNRLKTLLAAGADPNAVDQASGFCAMRVAIIREFERCVHVLIEAGANLEFRDLAGETPLFAAAAANCVSIVELLLAAGADPEAPNGAALVPIDVSFHPQVKAMLEKASSSRRKKTRSAA